METNEEGAALVRRSVDYAIAHGESFESVRPRLLWVAGYRREPIVESLRACREALAASPDSVSLQRSAAMLGELAHGTSVAGALLLASYVSSAPQHPWPLGPAKDNAVVLVLKPVSVWDATERAPERGRS